MSCFRMFITTFPAIHRRTLPTPIGRNSGLLSRRMSLHAKNASIDVSSLVVSTGSFSVHISLIALTNSLLKSALIVP